MSFTKYLITTSGRKQSALLEEALGYVKDGHFALDLGAGALNETKYLLSKGYTVDAVDSEPSFVDFGKNLAANLIVSTFDTLDFPVGKYDLVNARYALPFNPPETFNAMFTRLATALKSGGIFIGQLFGLEDSWSDNKEMTFHTKTQVEALLDVNGLTILRLEEIKKEGKTALQGGKFWHVFDIIAKKK
ncbi:class I SAM-dependent methyltransferase [Candidatus Parcubacteria bacterium]|nr:class I SAM-dependent methyltransferase [Candidatus Parcubacteria bacterium]